MNLTTLIVGIVLIILGALGVGKNQRKNKWLVQLIGESGYRFFIMALGAAIVALSFFM